RAGAAKQPIMLTPLLLARERESQGESEQRAAQVRRVVDGKNERKEQRVQTDAYAYGFPKRIPPSIQEPDERPDEPEESAADPDGDRGITKQQRRLGFGKLAEGRRRAEITVPDV